VLFLVVDDLRNELGFTDKRKGILTPNLDALAAKSMVFDRAYVQQGVCSPSRNSFLSGRRPDTTKVWNFKNSFRETLGDAIHSLPGAFKDNGYITTGMGKVYHPGHPKSDDGALSWSLDKFPYFHPKNYTNKIADLPDASFQDGQTKDTAIKRLQELRQLTDDAIANGDTPAPFFLAVGIHKPHIPWVMPTKYLDMQLPVAETDLPLHKTAPKGACNVSFYKCENVEHDPKGPVGPYDPLPDQQIRTNRRLYRAAMTWTDYLIGEVLQSLDTNGFSNNTVVSFLGDHGWQLGEHGMW
jgi:arylsulfatase A-like enzyme